MPSADAAPNASPPDADSFVARLEDGWQRALVPAFLVLSYLFYATPYLLVVADAPVGEALGRSYEWALAGGPYFAYGVAYLLFVAAVSAAGTVVVVNLGAVGILLGAVASAPVALALTFATTEFVAEMTDERTDEHRNDGAGWA